MKVLGIGERKTPNPFIAACDKFTYLEIINANRSRVWNQRSCLKQGMKEKLI